MCVRLHLLSASILIALCLFGCDRDDKVVVYTTPKESPRANDAAPSTGPASMMPPVPAIDASKLPPAQTEISWALPQSWQQLPGDGQMRYATIQVLPEHPEVQLSVIPLGAEAADLLPNVTRWEGQVGLPPSTMTDLPSVVKRVTVGDLNI